MWNKSLDLHYKFNGQSYVYVADFKEICNYAETMLNKDLRMLDEDELLDFFEENEEKLTEIFESKARREYESK